MTRILFRILLSGLSGTVVFAATCLQVAHALTLEDVKAIIEQNAGQMQRFSTTMLQTLERAEEGVAIDKQRLEYTFLRRAQSSGDEDGSDTLDIEQEVNRLYEGWDKPKYTVHTLDVDGERFRHRHTQLSDPKQATELESLQFDAIHTFDGSVDRAYTLHNRRGVGGLGTKQGVSDIKADSSTLHLYSSSITRLFETLFMGEDKKAIEHFDSETNTLTVRVPYGVPEEVAVRAAVLTVRVDPAKGFLPDFVEYYEEKRTETGPPEKLEHYRLEATLQSENGVIFPKEFTESKYVMPPSPYEGFKTQQQWWEFLNNRKSSLLSVKKVETLNFEPDPEFADDLFLLEWPPGTTVYDRVTGNRRTIQTD
jgi:hypothetical protein